MAERDRFNLTDKRVLLVGATGILGRGYASAIVEAGAKLAIADLSTSDVIEFAETIGAVGIEMDVADEQSVVDGVQTAIDRLGGLDGAITNSAATGEFLMKEGDAFAPFEEYPLSAWQRALDINLTGTFLVAREAGRAMKAGGGGSLVTVSSIYGIVAPDHRMYENQPFKSFASYSASKAGVIGLTKWLSTWWGRDGIRVNSVTPGGVFNDHNEEFSSAYGDRTPMGRMADRDELVGMVVFLLSDASSYCTGQNYIVDGGLSTW
ncbi:MAG: SDR family oxidoreductase [Alphaproteobacteria bacterium]|nr:SDR family oxidoreductase [Alphaproteobacteria bacterium]